MSRQRPLLLRAEPGGRRRLVEQLVGGDVGGRSDGDLQRWPDAGVVDGLALLLGGGAQRVTAVDERRGDALVAA